MGSNIALPYANIYIATFGDESIYPNPLLEQLIWLRYNDDIFYIWLGTLHTHALNSIYPKLQFTIHQDDQKKQFLDSLVTSHRATLTLTSVLNLLIASSSYTN